MAETQRTSDIYGILLDRNRPRVLMMKGEDSKWTLPHVHLPDQRLWLPTVGIVCEHMRNLLEADLTVLRGVFTGYSADRTNVELIYNSLKKKIMFSLHRLSRQKAGGFPVCYALKLTGEISFSRCLPCCRCLATSLRC
jgi:hypothetical protein